MRLIDADLLLMNTDKESIHAYEIALAPTVEAIPIEWIEEWYKNALKKANDGEDIAVDVMYKDWRRHKILEKWGCDPAYYKGLEAEVDRDILDFLSGNK